MRATLLSALCFCAVLTGPDRVLAQNPGGSDTDGIWWEVSAAGGGMLLSCAICDPEREIGPALAGALGTYANPAVRVGLDGGVWANDDGEVRESVYRGGVVAHLHVRPGSGLHLVGGLGWSGYRAELYSYDAVRLTVGAGWDLPLTEGWVVGNRLLLDAASFGALKNDEGEVAGSVGLSVLTLSMYVRRR